LGAFPQVKEFIDKHSKSFPALKIEYERGANPSMVLYDVNNQEIETLNIENWKSESLQVFLQQKLPSN